MNQEIPLLTWGISPEKLRRLNSRLATRTDRQEQGQLLPRTLAALQADDPEVRLRKLVEAIAVERLIVPATIEDHSSGGNDSLGDNYDESERMPLVVDNSSQRGQAILAFTSLEQLLAWKATARPMPMSAVKVALTAVATGTPRLWIDPQGNEVWIPRPAVESLASGGQWIPAWCDQELAAELSLLAQNNSSIEVKVTLVPAVKNSSWSGGLRVLVGFSGVDLNKKTTDSGEQRQAITRVLNTMAQSDRLQVATEEVEFVPQIF